MPSEQPYVSIIIPSYNRLHSLSACLASLEKLDYPRDRFEVIVVNDGSAISLDAAIVPFQTTLPLKLITQDNAGPATARNTGAKAAKGSILAFTDDDCQPAVDWLRRLIPYFRKPVQETSAPIAVGGQVLNALPQNLYATASQGLVDYLYTQYNTKVQNTGFFTSNNMALSARDFHRIGGFDQTFPLAAAEDREFCDRWRASGYLLIYAPEVKVYHAHDLTLKSFWRQQFNYGRGAFHYYQTQTCKEPQPSQRQPWVFYLRLLTYPLQSWGLPKALLITALFWVSQIAVVMGRLTEARRNSQIKTNSASPSPIPTQRSVAFPTIWPTTRKRFTREDVDTEVRDLIEQFPEALPYLAEAPWQANMLNTWLREYGDISPPRFYTLADRNLVYMEVPKVACTSIKLTIGHAYGMSFETELDSHDHQGWNYGLGKPQKSQGCIFAFVRNPFDRLVSCYRDKVVGSDYFSETLKMSHNRIPSDISFEEFVKIIVKIPDFLADKHFKSQYALLSHNGQLLPNFIGHFETLKEDWLLLAKKHKFDHSLAHKNAGKMREKDNNTYHNYYTPELINLVYLRYQNDFSQLGYVDAREQILNLV